MPKRRFSLGKHRGLQDGLGTSVNLTREGGARGGSEDHGGQTSLHRARRKPGPLPRGPGHPVGASSTLVEADAGSRTCRRLCDKNPRRAPELPGGRLAQIAECRDFRAGPAPPGAGPAPSRARLRFRRLPLDEGSGPRLACSDGAQWELGGVAAGRGRGGRRWSQARRPRGTREAAPGLGWQRRPPKCTKLIRPPR